jgi:hypothetical protein
MATAHQKEHKYYPEMNKTPNRHMNQQRKNVPSTKKPFEVCNVAAALRGKKVKDIFVNGKFPMQLRSGNKYIMVMVEIVSNTILLEPMKSRKDAEMI